MVRAAAAFCCAAVLAGCATAQKPPPSPDQEIAEKVKGRVEAVFALRERAVQLKHDSQLIAKTTYELQGKRLEASERFTARCEPQQVSPGDDCPAMGQTWVEADVKLLEACATERTDWQRWVQLNQDTKKLNQSLAALEPDCPRLSEEKARQACDELAWEGKGRLSVEDDSLLKGQQHADRLEQLCELVQREAELLRARALKRGY